MRVITPTVLSKRPSGWRSRIVLAVSLLAVVSCGMARAAPCAAAVDLVETIYLAERVAKGKLPPVQQRVPTQPSIVEFDGKTKRLGTPGGDLNMLIGRAKDTRLLVVYGYARLVAYDETFRLVADLLESFEVEDNRVFTLRLRKGHKWSDGHPFTSEDFRYWWEDVANNKELSPTGPPISTRVDGELPKVEILDSLTVRYSWSNANPYFLPRLAGAAPLFIYRPAHYLRNFHKKYTDISKLSAIKKSRLRNWAALHNRLDKLYKFNNPDLPTLQPWRILTKPPANRYIAERNPYFHRIDTTGRQLPYLDRVILQPTNEKLIPAKAGTGESDLQARGITIDQLPFLKQNEELAGYRVLLWQIAKGAHFALFPNLNHNDPTWRALFRDVRFRRALSISIDREGINKTLFYGLALTGNNTVLPSSPLYRKKFQTNWSGFDTAKANALLDEIGLTERDDKGIRLLPDGRPIAIIVETAGEETEQTDILELISDDWRRIGIKLFTKPSQRDILRNRVFSGATLMSVWSGFENGVPTPDMSPAQLAPTRQQSLQWSKWGQYYETAGLAGERPDLPEAQELLSLNDAWREASSMSEREKIWLRMLKIHCEQQFTIGVVAGVIQPVVASKRLRNIPDKAIFNWNPGALFGIYRPDTFWLE